MPPLSPRQIHRLVNGYIGVSGGYLGDFGYRSHSEFYMGLDLDIDPDSMPGTTRERFIRIVNESTPDTQSKIIRGILERYPVGTSEGRTQGLHDELDRLASELAGNPQFVSTPVVSSPGETMREAIKDAEVLLQGRGAEHAVDRIHTAAHAYLRDLCNEAGIEFDRLDTARRLMTRLIEQHPILRELGIRSEEMKRTLRPLVSVIDALGTSRNNATLAHPNETILGPAEAQLSINAAFTVVTYIEQRLLQ